MKRLAYRVQCSGQRNDGARCTHIRIDPGTLLWWCRHHEAQDGKKRLVTAVVPAWAKPGYYDDEEWDEYGIIPQEF